MQIFCFKVYFSTSNPASIYFSNDNNRNTRKRCEMFKVINKNQNDVIDVNDVIVSSDFLSKESHRCPIQKIDIHLRDDFQFFLFVCKC